MSRFETTEHLLTHVLKVDHKIASDLASGAGIRGLMDHHCAESHNSTPEYKLALLRRLQEIGVGARDVAKAVVEIMQKQGYSEAAAWNAVDDGVLELLDRAIYHHKPEKKPRLGVAVFGTDDGGRLLLGRRGKHPNFGKLVLPGGGLEWGETIEDCARRELKEETGVAVSYFEPREQHTHEVIAKNEHRVIVVVRAFLVPGEPKVGDDLLAAQYYSRNEIPMGDVSDVVRPILQRFGWTA